MLHSIHFSLEEANETLEELKPMISEMSELKKSLDDKNYDVYRHEYFGGLGPNGDGSFRGRREEHKSFAMVFARDVDTVIDEVQAVAGDSA